MNCCNTSSSRLDFERFDTFNVSKIGTNRTRFGGTAETRRPHTEYILYTSVNYIYQDDNVWIIKVRFNEYPSEKHARDGRQTRKNARRTRCYRRKRFPLTAVSGRAWVAAAAHLLHGACTYFIHRGPVCG